MPVRIHVKDFQSIEDASIVVDGFTAVTGTNNTGKTAIMRAVQGAFSNPPGDAFVRHGAEKFVVNIDFMDGHTLQWEKGPKVKPTYTIDGVGPINPGRAVPEQALMLGIKPVRAGAGEVWPQIAPQFTGQVFLLDLPGSALAEAVADVDRVGRLTQALRLAEADKRSFAGSLRLREKDVVRIKDEVEAFAGLDAVAVVVNGIEDLLRSAQEVADRIAEVRALAERLATARHRVDALTGIHAVHVPKPERSVECRAAGAETAAVRSMRGRLVASRTTVSALGGIAAVCVPPPPTEAIRIKGEIAGHKAQRIALRSSRGALARATAAATAAASVPMARINEQIAKGLKVKTMNWIRDLALRLRNARTEITTLTTLHTSQHAKAEQAVLDVREILGGLGECPVCGTPVVNP